MAKKNRRPNFFGAAIVLVLLLVCAAVIFFGNFGELEQFAGKNAPQNGENPNSSSVDSAGTQKDSTAADKINAVVAAEDKNTAPPTDPCLRKCYTLREGCREEGKELLPDSSGCYDSATTTPQNQDINCEQSCFVQ